jgi:DNA mismatch repair protein MutS
MKKLIFLSWCFLLSLSLAASEKDKPTTLTKKMAQENLRTLTQKELPTDTNMINSLISDEKSFVEMLEEKILLQLNLDPCSKRQAVFALLERYEEEHPFTSSDVLEEGTWKDLELLCGPKNSLATYVAAKVDRTVTEVGRAMLYRTIIQPKRSLEELHTQQNIIKKLVDDEALFNDLDCNLRKLAIPENVLLSFWREDVLSSLLGQSRFSIPFEKNVALLKALSERVNGNEYLNMADQIFGFTGFLAMFAISAATTVTIPVQMILEKCSPNLLDDTPSGRTIKKIGDRAPRELNLYSISGLAAYGTGFFWGENQVFKNVIRIVAGYTSAWSTWRMAKGYHEGLKIGTLFQKKLIHLAAYVDSLNAIICTIKKHPDLCALMPHIAHLDETIGTLRKTHEDFDKLLYLLGTRTFKGEPSFFSFWARQDITYRLMEQEKENFSEIMVAIGELDACMSTARLYKEKQHNRVCYCFPEYREVADGCTQVAIKDFWHPGLDDQTVVTNSLDMHDQNIVITGPNAAGKSTIMKAFVISIVLAQSLGIAPAQSLAFTPFSKIVTYLNITDDFAAGNSYFKAGVMRARTVIDLMSGITGNNVGLAVVDEVFNGTTFKEGQAAAYSFIQYLGSQKNVLVMATTHFPLMVNLANDDSRFLNYKVYVDYDANGKIIYPYRLEPGVSAQVVTFKILKDEGFTDAFIEGAETLVHGSETKE